LKNNERIGIFGGTFNPVHLGHLNGVLTVARKQKLNKVFVVPTRENPLKSLVDGPTPEQRLEMVKIAFDSHQDIVEVDEQEILRPGPSYTIDTLRNYAKTYSPEQLFLMIGADQLETFDQWKDYEEILTIANLLVTTRPGTDLPHTAEELPTGLQKIVDVFERNFMQLQTGRYIEFVRLEDLDISATDIRRRLRSNRTTLKQLSLSVEEYIKAHGLYAPIGPKIGDFGKFTNFCADVLFARKALQVTAFDLREVEAASEFVLIASGTSTRHATALAENIVRQVKDEYGVFPQSIEGMGEGRWVLLDYGSLIVHVFYDFVRQEYRIEDLWRKGREIPLVDPAQARQT
jgi:nicotinate-nucleotide adenylyltransferase